MKERKHKDNDNGQTCKQVNGIILFSSTLEGAVVFIRQPLFYFVQCSFFYGKVENNLCHVNIDLLQLPMLVAERVHECSLYHACATVDSDARYRIIFC